LNVSSPEQVVQEPVIVEGEIGEESSRHRFVQIWVRLPKPQYGREHECVMSISKRTLTIHPECSDALLPIAWELYRRYRAAEPIEATHTIRWTFGRAEFEEINHA